MSTVSTRKAGWGWQADSEKEHWYRAGSLWPACGSTDAYSGEVFPESEHGFVPCGACQMHFQVHQKSEEERRKVAEVDRRLKEKDKGAAHRRYLPKGGGQF